MTRHYESRYDWLLRLLSETASRKARELKLSIPNPAVVQACESARAAAMAEIERRGYRNVDEYRNLKEAL